MARKTRTAKREVEAWTHPVGTVVEVTKDDGSVVKTKTRSAPAVVGGSAVIWLDGITGCYLLSRCRAVEIPRERAGAPGDLSART